MSTIDKYRQNHFNESDTAKYGTNMQSLMCSILCSIMCILAIICAACMNIYVLQPHHVDPWSIQGIVALSPAGILFVLAYMVLVSQWED